jgi:hypothetical protein
MKLLTEKKYQAKLKKAKEDGYVELIRLLQDSDKVFIGPVTMKGNNPELSNSTFFAPVKIFGDRGLYQFNKFDLTNADKDCCALYVAMPKQVNK